MDSGFPVAITGLGYLGAAGAALGAVRDALRRGAVPLTEVDRSEGYHRPHGSRLAALVHSDTLARWQEPGQVRRTAPPSRFASAATRQALEAAGLADRSSHAQTAIVLGTCYGPSSVTVKLLRQIFELGPEQVSPALFTESVGNAPASQVAIAWRMLGPNLAIQQREASGLLALLQAVQLLRRKAAERVLVLEVEEMIPLLHAVLDRFHALAHRTPQDEERPRPFDRRRNGFLAAEGATALVLEPLQAVETRGGSVLALLRGGVAAFDPTAPPWDWGSGAPMLAAKLRHGLERLGIPLGSLEAIVAGGSGSVRGDRLEAEVLRSLFGEALPPLVAPKAVFGEYGGGLLASAVALLQPGTPLPPSEDFEVDPELGIALAKAWSSPGRVLVSSVASGGPAAWIVLERAPGACA